jgi:hypothetical protein
MDKIVCVNCKDEISLACWIEVPIYRDVEERNDLRLIYGAMAKV